MELAQKYVYEVYKAKSFSNAAKALFISQPSLSAMVKKLEAELEFRIFDRTKSPLTLTPQGEIYISYLEECFENEIIMKKRIKSISGAPRRELFIGGGSFFSSLVYPRACREIKAIMPDISIKIDMGSYGTTHNIKDKIDSKILDLGLVYSVDSARFENIPILEERYYFTLHRDFPGAEKLIPFSVSLEDILACRDFSKSNEGEGYIPSDILLLRRSTLPAMDLRSYISEFPVASFGLSNIRSGEMYYDMMLQGLGADISSDVIIAAKSERSQNVIFVPIGLPQGKRTACVIYKRGVELSDHAKVFVSVMQNICADKQKFLKTLSK